MKTTLLDCAPHCPVCDALLNAVTDPTGRAEPQDADVTICVYCGTPLVFDGPTLREIDVSELPRGIARRLAKISAAQKEMHARSRH